MKLPKPAINMAQTLYNSLRTEHMNDTRDKRALPDAKAESTRQSAWRDLVSKAASKVK